MCKRNGKEEQPSNRSVGEQPREASQPEKGCTSTDRAPVLCQVPCARVTVCRVSGGYLTAVILLLCVRAVAFTWVFYMYAAEDVRLKGANGVEAYILRSIYTCWRK